MKVIIPAAGRGTRMRPFTHTKAKPVLPVAGKPMLNHIMDYLSPLNPTKYYFITGHLRDNLEAEIRKFYGKKVELDFIHQENPRGTAQAFWLAEEAYDEPVLGIFADTVFETDLSVIEDSDADAIFWAQKVQDPSRFGVLVTDKEGFLTEMIEKPKEFVGDLVSIGVFYFKNYKLFKEGLDQAMKLVDQTTEEVYHVEAFKYMMSKGAKIKVEQVDGWYDCGTIPETLKTNAILLEKNPQEYDAPEGVKIIPPVAIDIDAEIRNSTIGPNVHIGPYAVVDGCELKDCIIDGDSEIKGCVLHSSIIGQHVKIQNKKGSFMMGDHSTAD